MSRTTCRIIVDSEPQSGAVNMAADSALLTAADKQPGSVVLRMYRWAEPTISLGYFQKSAPPMNNELAACPRVRRLTGGGAILHHHELTYSCVLPRTHALQKEPLRLYEKMHQAISEVLADCGVTAGFRADLPLTAGDDHLINRTPEEPFLCFLRADPRDLALESDSTMERPKIVGSAQRRRRGTILQHGSILLRASPLLPDMAGICDKFPDCNVSTFANTLPQRLASAISDDQIVSEYTDQERELTFQSLQDQSIQVPREEVLANALTDHQGHQ